MPPRTSDTKEAILQLGTSLIQTYGYNAFSYADIARELQIKNAAVHYHFRGKEDLLAAIVEQYIQRYRELSVFLENPAVKSKEKLKIFIDRYGILSAEGKICLIGSVSTDYHTLPDSVKEKITELINLVIGLVEKVLKEGKKKGELKFSEPARIKATLFMTNLAAGVQLARITGQDDYKAIGRELLKQLAS